MKLKDILKNVAVEAYSLNIDLEMNIAFATPDSRKVTYGCIFVAVKGEKYDGNKYINEAIYKGALAVVTDTKGYLPKDKPWILVKNSRIAGALIYHNLADNPSLKMNMIGITGTNGKSSTARILTNMLMTNGALTGMIGTIENTLGNKEFEHNLTTPDSAELAKLLKKFVQNEAKYTVMEVSSIAITQSRCVGIEYDVAVFTNFTQDHLDFHKTMENYLNEKIKLFSGLGKENNKKSAKMAVINRDDPVYERVREACDVTVVTYGLSEKADVRAKNIKLTTKGTYFDLCYCGREFPIEMNLFGRFNVYNALAATATALVEGVSIKVIQKVLSSMKPVKGRFEPVFPYGPDMSPLDLAIYERKNKYKVFIDFSHTPDGIKQAIETAREMTRSRVIVVFGCGGNRDHEKRPIMGNIASSLADVCIITSDNPRDEKPMDIINDIKAGISAKTAEILTEPDRKKAINLGVGICDNTDILIICGKGHETTQIIGRDKIPFSDMQEAQRALKSRFEVDKILNS